MAKITIVLEDTPEGVEVSCYGKPLPNDEKQYTDAQMLSGLIRDMLERVRNEKNIKIH